MSATACVETVLDADLVDLWRRLPRRTHTIQLRGFSFLGGGGENDLPCIGGRPIYLQSSEPESAKAASGGRRVPRHWANGKTRRLGSTAFAIPVVNLGDDRRMNLR